MMRLFLVAAPDRLLVRTHDVDIWRRRAICLGFDKILEHDRVAVEIGVQNILCFADYGNAVLVRGAVVVCARGRRCDVLDWRRYDRC
jgi:hypothetical protein